MIVVEKKYKNCNEKCVSARTIVEIRIIQQMFNYLSKFLQKKYVNTY